MCAERNRVRILLDAREIVRYRSRTDGKPPHLPLKPMPAAAGHVWVEARPFAIATSNDQPRGT